MSGACVVDETERLSFFNHIDERSPSMYTKWDAVVYFTPIMVPRHPVRARESAQLYGRPDGDDSHLLFGGRAIPRAGTTSATVGE